MHRHGYTGRKLSLEQGPRKALIRGLATSLVLHEQITTTEAKAKEIAPYVERLVTKAKAGDLASQRALRASLLTENAVQKLLQELTPAFAERNGGYTRIVKAGNRRGDNAPMAIVALVLPERLAAKPKATQAKEPTEAVVADAPTTPPKAKATKTKATS